jgi:uncharacterized cysteine cluster protein YcgN (CxxCxxCC family)
VKSKTLSEIYFSSTSNIQREATELYEDLHTECGQPHINWIRVMELVKAFKNRVSVELDTVTTACDEYNESNDGHFKLS